MKTKSNKAPQTNPPTQLPPIELPAHQQVWAYEHAAHYFAERIVEMEIEIVRHQTFGLGSDIIHVPFAGGIHTLTRAERSETLRRWIKDYSDVIAWCNQQIARLRLMDDLSVAVHSGVKRHTRQLK